MQQHNSGPKLQHERLKWGDPGLIELTRARQRARGTCDMFGSGDTLGCADGNGASGDDPDYGGCGDGNSAIGWGCGNGTDATGTNGCSDGNSPG